MKEKRIIVVLAVILAVLILVTVLVKNLKPENSETNETEISQEESTRESEESEQTRETEIVVASGGKEDKMLYNALLVINADEQSKYGDAISDLEELASDGNSDAQFFLGEMYLQGIGVDADIATGAKYLEEAYENGNEYAFDIYGKLKFTGEGLEQDYETALSAFLSYSDSQADIDCAIGIMYTYGMGVCIDYEKAATYLDKAASAGNATASTVKASIAGLKYTKRDSETEIKPSLKSIVRVDYSQSDIEELTLLVEQVREKLKSGEAYPAFDNELEAMAKANPSTVSTIAIFGKDNWLFYQNEIDGDSYNDYVGNNAFSDKELAQIKENLEGQEKKAQAAESEFVLLIYPNKEVIYSDKMPSYIKRETEETRTDKLVEYLRQNTDIKIFYPKEEYMDLKNDYQLYYATDTHCNMIGTFISLKEMLNDLYGKNLNLDLSQFDIHSTEYTGDIGVMIGRDDRYNFDKVYFLSEKAVSDGDKVDASMTLIGDSFSEFLNIEAGYYFNNGVSHYMVNSYSYDYNAAMKAALSEGTSDIIVWECAERCVDRLK